MCVLCGDVLFSTKYAHAVQLLLCAVLLLLTLVLFEWIVQFSDGGGTRETKTGRLPLLELQLLATRVSKDQLPLAWRVQLSCMAVLLQCLIALP